MYPYGTDGAVRMRVPGITDMLEGAHRPGHFDGVATVVTRLFNLVQPDVAVFGRKDYQQLLVIRHLVRDLAFPIELLAATRCASRRPGDELAQPVPVGGRAPRAPEIHRTLLAMRDAAVARRALGQIERRRRDAWKLRASRSTTP